MTFVFGDFSENQSWSVVKMVKTYFITCFCNRGKEISVQNWAAFQYSMDKWRFIGKEWGEGQ